MSKGVVTIRRAGRDDADFLTALLTHPEVEPFLAAVRPKDRSSVLAEIERSQDEPAASGVFVIEDGGRSAGMMTFERANARSRIAHLGGLAVHPDFRGRHLADEAARAFQRDLLLDLGFHRLQLEIYGFNERAMRHAERVGFVREGVKRKAYRRHGEWVDGVMYGLVREDLGLPPPVDLLYEYVARLNEGVRTGDWEPLGECFADDVVLTFEGKSTDAFAGRETVLGAHREQPPAGEVRVLGAEAVEGGAAARYALTNEPDRDAGTMRLRPANGRIAALTIGRG